MRAATGRRGSRLRTVLVSTALLAGLVTLPAPGPGASAASNGCWLAVSPTSGPVGTRVSISGSNATCNNDGHGGVFGFADEQAGVIIGSLPAKGGPFSFRFRIPATMPAGEWWAAAQAYVGGGPVAPGPAQFVAPMLYSADFDVTWAPPGWADFVSVTSTAKRCCVGSDAYDLIRAGGFVDTSYYAPNAVGNAGDVHLAAPIVAAAFTPDGGGYWMLGADGGILTYGNARFFGSAADVRARYPFVGLAPTPDGAGYWLVATGGGVFSYGDAHFYGASCVPPAPVSGGISGAMGTACAAGSPILLAPAVGIASTPDGGGYWLVTSSGGVFSFGDASFYGSMGGRHLNGPVVGVAATKDGHGYWLVGDDGGVFSFGDARFAGSAVGVSPWPMVGLAPTADGHGYWLLARDGGVFTYGDAGWAGSGRSLRAPATGTGVGS